MPKILVVDDEPKIVTILERLLTMKGFEVLSAEGGEKALEILNSDTKVDLLIIDKKMPKIDGIAVLKEMAKQGRKLSVIVLTGSLGSGRGFSKEEIQLVFPSQISYLTKPIDFKQFLDAVNKVLGITPS